MIYHSSFMIARIHHRLGQSVTVTVGQRSYRTKECNTQDVREWVGTMPQDFPKNTIYELMHCNKFPQ